MSDILTSIIDGDYKITTYSDGMVIKELIPEYIPEQEPQTPPVELVTMTLDEYNKLVGGK